MKVNKYFIFAIIYFFINSLGLPQGLLYTSLLSPLFYWWVVSTRKTVIMFPFFFVIVPFFIVHTLEGVDMGKYVISLVNLAAVYIFCQAFYTFLITCKNPEPIFKKLLIITFVLCLVAIPCYFTKFYYVFWIQQYLTEGIDNYRRLKLFTYEASYMATLFTPLFSFYFLQILLRQNKINAWLLFVILFTPYVLSFSLGVISTVIISLGMMLLIYPIRLLRKRRVIAFVVLSCALFLVTIVLATILFPHNTLFTRISNIFEGKDTSGRGRTTEAFLLSNKILKLRSEAFGIGPGQLKVLGANIVREFYSYPLDYNVTAIPNASAETLVVFGWVGFAIRLLSEIALFFYTRVWTNYYRLWLFLFIFIYQFTGSYITSTAEYVIWILAFTNVFPQFDIIPQKYINNPWLKEPYVSF